MTWLEALPPLIIVCAGVAAMGSLQSALHRAYYGKNKKVQKDHFTHLMDKRDARIDAEAKSAAASSK